MFECLHSSGREFGDQLVLNTQKTKLNESEAVTTKEKIKGSKKEKSDSMLHGTGLSIFTESYLNSKC